MNNRSPASNVLLLPLNQKIDERFARNKADIVKVFAQRYFASSANAELARSTDEEMLELVETAWDFIHVRRSGLPSIAFKQVHASSEQGRSRPRTRVYVLLNDMPFVVDSMRQCLIRMGTDIHRLDNTVIHVKRAKRTRGRGGDLRDLSARPQADFKAEALSCFECGHLSEEQCRRIEKELKATLRLVSIAVKDFEAMQEQAREVRQRLLRDADSLPVSTDELKESTEFISWLIRNHFTFLGYEKYTIKHGDGHTLMELQKDSVLGVSRHKTEIKPVTRLDELPEGTAELILRKQICSFAKSSIRSKIHRPAYYDYVLVKEFNAEGEVETEHRFTGLYTSSVYFRPALDIPLVRNKVRAVLDRSGFSPNGHSMKDLLQIINVFPRDELFQMSMEQLYTTSVAITQIRDTRTCKLFVRKDSYGKFFSCLIYVPRDIYTTRVRLQIQEFLRQRLQASELEYNIYLSESILARLHLVLRVPRIQNVKYDLVELEQALTELVKPWEDYFLDALRDRFPDPQAEDLFQHFSSCFPPAYKEHYQPGEAIEDVERLRQAVERGELVLDLAPCRSQGSAELRFKIFSLNKQLYLSDVDPILENLGLYIISEKTFRLSPDSETVVWLHDFSLFRKNRNRPYDAGIEEKFEDAFSAVWHGLIDDDGFNALVVNGAIHWRDVALLRAYAAYLKQIQFGYGMTFIAETLSRHEHITRELLRYFYELFQPDAAESRSRRLQALRRQILGGIDEVVNLSEDSVLRAYLELLEATQRTNFFQPDEDGKPKDYFSFKLKPGALEFIPRPRPQYEVFVYSRQVEGVHLRFGKVARGGLRWSDRSEDYRTEILGLVKAQQVKNAVIVPVGAKGGFVVKQELPEDREQAQQLGIASYKTFVRGLLDLTDNLSSGKVTHPPAVVRRDEDDTYLVVAADKGTASFSDIANGLAEDYGFWLGDGFASGGSRGYDHKAMGITARGAWVSVQRHFRELGINVQKEEITVLGIGDMSGDVFGNGMLLSRSIQLVAAFNHRYIFVDPNPDARASFRERQRLFRKKRSSWSDYDTGLISTGGGVFDRNAKSIELSAQIKKRFGIDRDRLTPNQLIKQLLKSPVDLIWNGGIGTYVKSSDESHGEVGDKSNDALRVDADELRCRVIGEGGNLGLTQKARIEFGLNGGISVTDFVDNSGGVDCSDHEVNIKILLNPLYREGRLEFKKRNELLKSMEKEVAALVLDNNYSQVQAISLAESEARERHKEFSDLVAFLERHAGLDRELEDLPDDETLEQRASRNQSLTRPELAVLTSYMKMFLKSRLIAVDYIDDHYLEPFLFSAFPDTLQKQYEQEILEHSLRREIVATQIANSLVNQLGPGFFHGLMDSTNSSVSEVVKAALIMLEVFDFERHWSEIETLDYRIDSTVQTEMMASLIRLMRRVTRWMLRYRKPCGDFLDEVSFFESAVRQFENMLPEKLPPDYCSMFRDRVAFFQERSVPEALARAVARADFLFTATSFAEIAASTGEKLNRIVESFYEVGEQLNLNWLGKVINQLPVSNYWQVLAKETFLDDLAWQQRMLTIRIVTDSDLRGAAGSKVQQWAEQRSGSLSRIEKLLSQLQSESQPEYAMFSVILRELLNLSDHSESTTL